MPDLGETGASARAAVASNGFWYHTMELAPGVVTPGWFDLRPIVERMPWPDVRGKRCLDVGPYDGFLSFELERRGAGEVLATDIADPHGWDWRWADRILGPRYVEGERGSQPGRGFEIAKRILGSRAERVEISAYELAPERIGTFDVVVCGSLLLHLRDPVRALEAIRGVCREHFLSAETVSVGLTAVGPRTPLARMRNGIDAQWWIPNAAGHRAMLESAGFEVERSTRPYAIPFGSAHPARRRRLRLLLDHLPTVALTGRVGVAHAAALARPSAAQPGALQE